MSVKELKSKIFAITKHMNLGRRDADDTAYKLFIDHSYKALIQAWWFVNGGLTNGSALYANEQWKTPDVDSKALIAIERAVTHYLHMVRQAEPFTDLLSMLHEEILLTGRRGDRLGQFLTPADLAQALSCLVMDDDEIRSMRGVKTIAEPTCGVGSMILAPLARIAAIDPTKISLMDVLINDIDTLMCKAATVQLLASSMMHKMPFYKLKVYNCNLILDWSKADTLMLGIIPPNRDSECQETLAMLKMFEGLMKEINVN
ncbi:hypothetical protein E6W26_29080 [Pseudomonas aeruginosa]|uniref:hypothetical protein n=1 Tax=Pseudomonas aeruginosa TaxID=287 RepID=UPI00109DBBC5|nr:hypothetical protein [Pseudomonas aeruginosa]EKV1241271.1 hypothetical protein [Pseudomonas aeruginosa]EKV8586180.1 hypothetical protein [Pseudomonas aeruginosa]ELN5407398.1 hypothetical protein [Pseudomonas aeruginosa]ELP1438589.1 hypothetical protein [Pseudomonas aeruginosa]THB16453.1 hypothetical protein E6W26_29080 [Pseudomonas aeruginosa]